jgi:hypothetical protein
VSAVAAPRIVSVTFNVTVPDATEATSRAVNLAGTLDLFEGGSPQWDPGGATLSRVNPTLWTITFSGREGTRLEYKYALASWDYVEKNQVCEEIPNRELTLTYGSNGKQFVNDTVLKWRNVAPCGE